MHWVNLTFWDLQGATCSAVCFALWQPLCWAKSKVTSNLESSCSVIRASVDNVWFGLHAPGRDITSAGMDPILALLKPVQDSKGRWTFNSALSTLDLGGAAPAPPVVLGRRV